MVRTSRPVKCVTPDTGRQDRQYVDIRSRDYSRSAVKRNDDQRAMHIEHGGPSTTIVGVAAPLRRARCEPSVDGMRLRRRGVARTARTEEVPNRHTAEANSVTDAVRLEAVSKVYGRGDGAVRALDDVSLTIPRGTFTAVMGPSGSGKSTFLHCAAGLDRPTSGAIRLGSGTDLATLSETELTVLRRTRIGFVFQSFNLVPSLDVWHNVTLPLRLAHHRADRAHVRLTLERVGLGAKAHSLPSQLSGGQQQRVAIARALITHPEVVFADEPTGALDSSTAREVLTLLRRTVDETGQTTVMVTHDPVAASYADAVVFLAAGRIADVTTTLPANRIAARMADLGAAV